VEVSSRGTKHPCADTVEGCVVLGLSGRGEDAPEVALVRGGVEFKVMEPVEGLTPFGCGGGAVRCGAEFDIGFGACRWVCSCVVGLQVACIDVKLVGGVALTAGVEAKGSKGVIGNGVEALGGVGAADVISVSFCAVR
jgi:hypothetical protein